MLHPDGFFLNLSLTSLGKMFSLTPHSHNLYQFYL